MKKLLLVVLGCIPFVVGWAVGHLLLVASGFYWLFAPLFLLAWGWLGWWTYSWGRGRTVVTLVHIPAVIVMAANLIQLIGFGQFFTVWTQHFFTPMLFFSVKITSLLPYTTVVLREDSVVSVLLMIGVFCLGRKIARDR